MILQLEAISSIQAVNIQFIVGIYETVSFLQRS